MKWGLWAHVFWYVVANVAQVIVWWLVTPDIFFWPLWSILGWGIGLIAHIWAVRVALRPRTA
ncbi:2TM domain-containing protein [Actinoplanes sp. CA-142083]|uniref:2TM domain-containing protein n=1 Tax=Actinoplanes sp. CA-142083 TaxID=3239903 RepID=UPI003D9499EF